MVKIEFTERQLGIIYVMIYGNTAIKPYKSK